MLARRDLWDTAKSISKELTGNGCMSSTPVQIGVGKPHWVAALLPSNRTGGSPASGSPVDCYWQADWHSRARVMGFPRIHRRAQSK